MKISDVGKLSKEELYTLADYECDEFTNCCRCNYYDKEARRCVSHYAKVLKVIGYENQNK